MDWNVINEVVQINTTAKARVFFFITAIPEKSIPIEVLQVAQTLLLSSLMLNSKHSSSLKVGRDGNALISLRTSAVILSQC